MSIQKHISSSFVSQLLVTIISFVGSVFLTRLLGADGRGELTIFSNANGLAYTLWGFGVAGTVSFFVNSGKLKAEVLLGTLIVFSLLSTLFVILSLAALYASGKISWVLPKSIQTFTFAAWFVVFYINTLLHSIFHSMLSTYKKFHHIAIINIIYQLILTAIYVTCYVLYLNGKLSNPIPIIITLIVSMSFVNIGLFLYLYIREIGLRPKFEVLPFDLLKLYFTSTIWLYLGSVFNFFSFKLDMWILDEYHGNANLGIYSLAVQFAQLLWLLPNAVSTVFYSYGSSMDEKESIHFCKNLMQITFLGSSILSLVGWLVSFFFIPFVFGNEFIPSIEYLGWLILGVVPYSLTLVLNGFFSARGKFTLITIICFFVFLIATFCYFIMIPIWGARGAAIGSSIAYLFSFIVSYLYYIKTYNQPLSLLFQIDKKMFELSWYKNMLKK